MTVADRLEFTVNEEEPQRIFTIVPGLDPQERLQIKPGDRVELEVVGTRLVIDVTGVDEDFRGVVRDVPSDLSVQLGLTAGQEISFRFAHIFFIDHS